jgi:hypothetical protein
MSLEKIVAEAMAGRPLEMKDAFAEEIELRIQTSLEEKYMEIVEAKKFGEVHGAAIDDHTSASADHRDLSDDNVHHKAAAKHHADAANALEYGRVKQANKSATMAKASAAKAGDKDLSKTSATIHADHHSGVSENTVDEAKKFGDVHGAAIDDHTSAAADHRDLGDDDAHHKAASKHHADAANALEYGRVKQANKSSAMAKASAAKAGDKDLSKTSAAIHAEHH